MLEKQEQVLRLLLWAAFMRNANALPITESDLESDGFQALERLKALGLMDDERCEQLESLERSLLSVHLGNAEAAIAALGGVERLRPLLSRADTAGLKEEKTAPMEVLHPRFGAPEIPFDLPEISSRYTHISEHASGGMGRVLIVHDKQLGRDIALKELLPPSEFDGDTSDSPARKTTAMAYRFIQEGMLTAKLEHPAIVPVYELGVRKDGSPYYTMKLVRGKTLGNEIKACTNTKQRLRLLPNFVAVCQAIAYAHGRGVIHRDIKPSNIMVGDFGETVVLDWGIAKLKRSSEPEELDTMSIFREKLLTEFGANALTELGQTVGTPGYMSPEQAMGRVDLVDERSDVFALGILLYEVLSGQRAFKAKSVAGLLDQAIRSHPEPLKELDAAIPAELVSICARAMEKDPRRRYASVKDMIADLSAFQAGALVSSHTYSWGEFLSRQYAKHRVRVQAFAAAAVVLIVGGVYSYYSIWQARNLEREQRVRAESAEQDALNNLGVAEEARSAAEFESLLANTRLLSRSLQTGDYPRVRELQAAQIPGADTWEWRHAAYETSREYASFGVPESGTFWMELDKTQTRALTLHSEHVARVWELPSGNLLFEAPKAKERLTWGALSPDATNVALSDGAGFVRVYDLTSKAIVAELDLKHEFCNAVAYLSNDELLAGTDDGRVRLWNWRAGAEAKVISRLPGAIATIHVARDTRRIAVSTQTWETALMGAEGIESPTVFPGRPGGFTRDGAQLCTSALGRMEVRDAASGELLWGSSPEAGEVTSVDVSFPGRIVAVTAGGAVIVYDAQLREVLLTWRDEFVRVARITEDGKRLATLDYEGRLNWVDLATGIQIDSSAGQQRGATFIPLRGSDVATYGGVGLVKFLRPDAALLSLGLWQGAGAFSRVQGIAGVANSTRLLLSREDGEVLFVDGASGSVLSAFTSPAMHFPRPLTASRDGALFAFSPDGYAAALLSASAPESINLVPVSTGLLASIALSGDHSRLATASHHGLVSLWRTDTREPLGEVACGDAHVTEMVFLTNPDTLVVASANGSLYKIGGDPPVQLAEMNCGSALTAIDFAPMANLLVVGMANGTVQLHDADTLEKLSGVMASRDVIDTVRFDAAGKRVFTNSSLDTFVWLVAADRKMHDVGLKLTGISSITLSGAGEDLWAWNYDLGLKVLRTGVPSSSSSPAQPVAALNTSVASQQQALAARILASAPAWLDTPLPVTLPPGFESDLLGKWGFRSGDQITAISSARNGALKTFGELLTLLASGENRDSPLTWEGARAGNPLRGRLLAAPVVTVKQSVSLSAEECGAARSMLVAAIEADAPQLRGLAYRNSSLLLGYPPAEGEGALWLPDVSNTPLQPWMPRMGLSVYDQILQANGAPLAEVAELKAAFEGVCNEPATPVVLTVGRGLFTRVELTLP